MRDLTFYLAITPPLPVPRLDVHVLPSDTEAGSTHSYTSLSRPPETRIPFSQDLLREVGHGHSVNGGIFQALPGVIKFWGPRQNGAPRGPRILTFWGPHCDFGAPFELVQRCSREESWQHKNVRTCQDGWSNVCSNDNVL